MRDLVEEVRIGVRMVAGTELPVVDQLHRTGEREWTVTRELCGGVPRSSEVYRSESAARRAFAIRITGRKPSRGSVASARIELRLTPEASDAWRTAAAAEGLSLSDWIHAACELALARGSTR
ncbi:MAG: hypothetical protein ACTHU0_19080 [Kofleriaceae bacterium]